MRSRLSGRTQKKGEGDMELTARQKRRVLFGLLLAIAVLLVVSGASARDVDEWPPDLPLAGTLEMIFDDGEPIGQDGLSDDCDPTGVNCTPEHDPGEEPPKVTLVLPPFPAWSDYVIRLFACDDAECNTEGDDWCDTNGHGGADEDDCIFAEIEETGHCTVTCSDGYMVSLEEDCSGQSYPGEVGPHLRRTVVTEYAPSGQVNRRWVEIAPLQPGQQDRIMLYDRTAN